MRWWPPAGRPTLRWSSGSARACWLPTARSTGRRWPPLAFNDPAALADLNAITHPAIGVEMLARRDAQAAADGVVVLAIPLLTAAHRETVGTGRGGGGRLPGRGGGRPPGRRRGAWTRADAEARIAAQVSRDERLREADYVVDNSSSLEDLAGQVELLWSWLQARRGEKASAAPTS